MTTQHIDTLIIGAGQAGLSTGYFLAQRGLAFLIVDGADRVGDNWREQWDTLRLYTPAKYDGLPGLPFPADDPWHFPGKDEVGDYLEAYALHWDLPVRMSTRVEQLVPAPGGGYLATLGPDAVSTISCDSGGDRHRHLRPHPVGSGRGRPISIPASSSCTPARTADRPSCPPVRCSWWGPRTRARTSPTTTAPTHEMILCGRDPGELGGPARVTSRPDRFCRCMLLIFKHVLNRRTPMGRKEMDQVRFHGGPSLRVKLADLDARGVERTEARFAGARDGRPLLDDGRVLDVASIVWCTGFQQRFDWVKLPIFDERGWPSEYRGVVEGAPGLYFCGLSFQYAFSSMILPGVGRDAGYVAEQIAARHAVRRAMVDA